MWKKIYPTNQEGPEASNVSRSGEEANPGTNITYQRIVCSHCGHSRKVPSTKFPDKETVTLRCQQCKQVFTTYLPKKVERPNTTNQHTSSSAATRQTNKARPASATEKDSLKQTSSRMNLLVALIISGVVGFIAFVCVGRLAWEVTHNSTAPWLVGVPSGLLVLWLLFKKLKSKEFADWGKLLTSPSLEKFKTKRALTIIATVVTVVILCLLFRYDETAYGNQMFRYDRLTNKVEVSSAYAKKRNWRQTRYVNLDQALQQAKKKELRDVVENAMDTVSSQQEYMQQDLEYMQQDLQDQLEMIQQEQQRLEMERRMRGFDKDW